MQVGTRDDNTFNQLQNAVLVEGMNLGYYVSVADDGGFQAAFGMFRPIYIRGVRLLTISIASGLQAGYATLDSIRAVKLSSNITGINPDPVVTMHGYSNGAQTIGWVSLRFAIHRNYHTDISPRQRNCTRPIRQS
jgi:hypothetical protein